MQTTETLAKVDKQTIFDQVIFLLFEKKHVKLEELLLFESLLKDESCKELHEQIKQNLEKQAIALVVQIPCTMPGKTYMEISRITRILMISPKKIFEELIAIESIAELISKLQEIIEQDDSFQKNLMSNEDISEDLKIILARKNQKLIPQEQLNYLHKFHLKAYVSFLKENI